jgi:transcription-repair coupling factor (superfamily II helicase)
VYFVHNEVKTIERIAEQLEGLLPEARIAIAHGQLPERELESIMLDFYHQRFNILLCTTIIESGIDVPTANTIIINRADRFGLAQLHQMRGRVGRSHHRAYAYLFTPPPKAMTSDAKKRLEAIESLEDLGAGFTLASHDLEIRGAGELLGEEQSGQIQEIGYAMYTELLERAVSSLKRGEEPLLDVPLHSGVEIDLDVPSLLPADYIYDVDTRLVLYKRISNAETADDLRELQVELIDRFGLLPEAAKNLFAQTELKIKLSALGVAKIKGNLQAGIIEFTDKPKISTAQLIKLIQFQPDRYQFDGKKTLSFKHECNTIQQQLDFLNNLLFTRLAEPKAA